MLNVAKTLAQKQLCCNQARARKFCARARAMLGRQPETVTFQMGLCASKNVPRPRVCNTDLTKIDAGGTTMFHGQQGAL